LGPSRTVSGKTSSKVKHASGNGTSTIESGFVNLPEEEHWLADYLHEPAVFNKGKYDDQVDPTSQALDWFRGRSRKCYGLLEYAKSISSAATPDPHYAAVFMRPRGRLAE